MASNYPSPSQVSSYAPGMSSPTKTTDAAAQMAATVRQGGTVYDIAFNMADPAQFAMAAAKKFDELRLTKQYAAGTNFANDLEYLQAAVRSSGLSKGTSQVGDISLEDYAAIQKVMQTSYIRGTDWGTTLERDLTSPYRNASGSSFSKEIATSMSLLDSTDAADTLSKAYYKAFGFYPSTKQVEKFKNQFNAEAKRQKTQTVTSGGTTSVGTGTSTSRNTVTKNQGFTQSEQDQFLAQFLKDNYKITGKEQSGYVKNVITAIKNAYDANLLPAEDDSSIIAFAADLVGTSDSNIANQKVDAKLQAIRNVAAKQYAGIADTLAAGQDASTVVDPIVKQFNSTLGTNITRNDSRIKQILNHNDGKTTRMMNASEIDSFIQQQPEFQTSSAGYAKYAAMGNALKDALR